MSDTPPFTAAAYSSPVRPSACPGLLRIVEARDGGICRVKLPCGQLNALQARTVASAAEKYGNGVIELTNRANLQIRGVRVESGDALIEALIAADLGPHKPGGDDVRNLMVSPTFGVDPEQIVDVVPLAERILDLLQMDERLHQLSPKFALLLDGGERSAMLEHPHDVWLSAVAGDDDLFAFGFAGCPPTAQPQSVLAVPVQHAFAFVEAVLHGFLDCAGSEHHRLRDLLRDVPAGVFLERVQQRLPCSLRLIADWQRKPAQPFAHIGIHPQKQAGLCHVGAVPALGRVTAGQLRVLAALSQFGDCTLRLTPRQSVLLPNVPALTADTVSQQLRAAGFAIERRDPLAHAIACSGATGCVKSRADTKADALLLADLLGKKFVQSGVHLSGCERSCAAAHVAPFTLLAVAAGHYDLYRRAEGSVDFGDVVAHNVDVAQAATLIAQFS